MSNEATDKDMIDEAREVVINILGLEKFITDNWGNIYARLEESEIRVWKAIEEKKCKKNEGHLLFLSESLPFINGVVHVGSSLNNFSKGLKWVRKKLPHADAVSVISALALLFIVDKAGNEFYDSNEEIKIKGIDLEQKIKKKDVWKCIVDRVEKHVKP